MLNFVMDLSAEVNILLLAVVSFLISSGGLWLLRRRRTFADVRREHDVIGFTLSAVGVIYGILLGFVLSMSWGEYSHTEEIATTEGVNLRILYYKSYTLPETNQVPVREAVLAYARAVAEDEWITLRHAKESKLADQTIMNLWKCYYSVQPTNETQRVWLQQSLNTLNEVTSQRRIRLLAAEQSVNPLLWELLFCGGIITISLILILGIERFHFHLLMTWAVTFLILLILFIIFELDNPFWGDPHIAPDAFLRFLAAHPAPT